MLGGVCWDSVSADPPTKPEKRKPKQALPVKKAVDLSGEWRVLLPAGFEHEIKLTRGEDGEYHLSPGNYTISGTYRLKDGLLVSDEKDDGPKGQYFWKQRSPYMLTLVKQTAAVGSDYTGAVLFRPREELTAKSKRAPSSNAP